MAWLYAATHREDEALPLVKKAAAIDDRMIGQVFSISSETQRMAYLRMLRGNFVGFLSLIFEYYSHSSTVVQTVLDLLLRRKAIGAEASAAQRDAVLGGRYPKLAPSLQALTTLRMEIAQKTLAGPGPEGLEGHRQLLAEKTARKERLEAELARRIPEMNLERHLLAADRRAVAMALPGGSALVEFVRFEVFDFRAVPARGEPKWKSPRYLAFILPAGEPDTIEMIDLGEAEPIDRMIASFRASVTGEAERDGHRGIEPSSGEPERVSVRSDRSALREALVVATRHARPRSPFEGDNDGARSLGVSSDQAG